MRRWVPLSMLVMLCNWSAWAQVRLDVLKLERKEVYHLLGTDILVVDTLILRDSSRIVLNKKSKDNFIHVKQLVIGRGVVIDGRGRDGIRGIAGAAGSSPEGPCKDGAQGESGKPGTNGTGAVNLFLYIDELKLTGNILIDLAGGDGGDGGKGAKGVDGNPGTKLCQGGNGGNGGTGGPGGNGGNAGNLTITSRYGTDLRSMIGEKIKVRSYGGFAGVGGEGGLPGLSGLGPNRDGAPGKRGITGAQGIPGKPGGIYFERK